MKKLKKNIIIILCVLFSLVSGFVSYLYFEPLPPFMIQNCTHPGDMGLLYVLEGRNKVSYFYNATPAFNDKIGEVSYHIAPITQEFPELYPSKTIKINLLQKLNILRITNEITVSELRYKKVGVNAVDKYFQPQYVEKAASIIFRYHMKSEHISYDFVAPDIEKNEYVIDGGENLAELAVTMIKYNPPADVYEKPIHKWIKKFDGKVVRKVE